MNFIRNNPKLALSNNRFYSIIILILLLILICFDGLYVVISKNHTTGDLNYIRTLLSFFIISIVLFRTKSININYSNIQIVLLFSFLTIFIMFLFSIKNFNAYVIVDISNFVLFCISPIIFYEYRKKYPEEFSFLTMSILFYYIFIICGIVLLFNWNSTRFSGMQLASSIFGMTVPILVISSYQNLKKNNLILYFTIFWSVFIIILSGTRLSLISFIAILFAKIVNFKRASHITLFTLSIIISALIIIQFRDYIDNFIYSGNVRAISLEDLEGGSAGTRIFWYYSVYNNLINSGFIGGYGANSHQLLTNGHILHFDIMRYWYDYSIVSAILIVIINFMQMKGIKLLNKIAFFFAGFFLLGFHNFLQTPDLIIIFSLFIASIRPIKNINRKILHHA